MNSIFRTTGWAMVLAMGVIMCAAAEATAGDPLRALLPGKTSDFSPAGQDGVFDRNNLFSLINGGAEVYRSLNVKSVISRTYQGPNKLQIICDIFDMGSSADAFGAYHHDMREGRSAKIGQESEQQGGNLTFWKDRYFVSLVALRPGPESQAAVLAIGRKVADRIPHSGGPPALMNWLPRQNLIVSQIHYFHDWALFSRLSFWSADNLLLLNEKTEGLLARYSAPDTRVDGGSDSKASLFIIRYPSAEKAKEAQKALAENWGCRPDDQPGHTKEQGWVGLRRISDVLVGVMDMPQSNQVTSLLDQVPKLRKENK